MNWRTEEEFLARREEDRNARITKTLAGRRKPPDEEIIKSLKEKRRKVYGDIYWKMPVLRKRDKYHRRKSRRRR